MPSYFDYVLPLILLWMQPISSMSLKNKHSYFMDSGTDSDVADFIVSKGYLPKEKDLPQSTLIKNVDNDATYLLSKLSDEELIKLLNDQPKKNVYDLNDIVKIAAGNSKPPQDNSFLLNLEQNKPSETLKLYDESVGKENRFRTVSNRDKGAFFRLEDKAVDPFSTKNDIDPNYEAVQKLNNLIYSRPQVEETEDNNDDDDEKRELLFDVLVNQLKTLCCKRNKPTKIRSPKKVQYKSLLSDLLPQPDRYLATMNDNKPFEYMFLILNDEIKGNGSEELISVDPDSLEKNSSVLLLGPIGTPLTDSQLKSVMSRISSELSKPDYIPLLQQLSEGTLSGNKVRLMKSLVSGPETRRYIKPHRCNHQSPLAKVYGGPKWLICTGYLNLNTPSLYD